MKMLNIALAFPGGNEPPGNEEMNAEFLYQIEDIFDISQAQCVVSHSGYLVFGEVWEGHFNELSYCCRRNGIKIIRPSIVDQVIEKMYQPKPMLKLAED